MAGINKVIIVGNLGRDPEVRYAQSGTAICNLNIAVTERVKQGDKYEDATEWFRVVLFGKQAESAAQYLAKGRQVYIEGKLRTKKYKDKDGTEKASTEVVADVMQFIGGGGEKKGGGQSVDSPPKENFADDDLPF